MECMTTIIKKSVLAVSLLGVIAIGSNLAPAHSVAGHGIKPGIVQTAGHSLPTKTSPGHF